MSQNEIKHKMKLSALKVNQWLKIWDEVHWNPAENRNRPAPFFYQFCMPATELVKLSGVYARTTVGRLRGSQDQGIQRTLNTQRTKEIHTFVNFGYPWSTLSKKRRSTNEYADLRQPGWLPTAIVVNILAGSDEREGKQVDPDDLIKVIDRNDGMAEILFPHREVDWTPKSIPPIEVIDGQHRLWAFQDITIDGEFELPVVAFVGLDLSWQAYLFYMINIKPKRINASLGFDLYPLLRAEKWLTKFEGPQIYRATRAQELVDLLWSHPKSPWKGRINMLGEAGQSGLAVSQSSWIKTLMVSFVKRWNARGDQIGGLFGSIVGQHRTVLRWTLIEQAAFLILIGRTFRRSIKNVNEPWTEALRNQKRPEGIPIKNDLAFYGRNNLINSDQGIRAILQIVNDFFFIRADELELHQWGGNHLKLENDFKNISNCIESLKKEMNIYNQLEILSDCLALYDWRTSNSPNLDESQRIRKASFRGAGGYKELRKDVLEHIKSSSESLGEIAESIIHRLGYS